MKRGKLLLAHVNGSELQKDGEKEANEAKKASKLENINEVRNTKCSQYGNKGNDEPQEKPEKPVKPVFWLSGCVVSSDENVEVVYADMSGEGVRRNHVQGGEQDQVIGEEAESEGVTRTSKISLK